MALLPLVLCCCSAPAVVYARSGDSDVTPTSTPSVPVLHGHRGVEHSRSCVLVCFFSDKNTGGLVAALYRCIGELLSPANLLAQGTTSSLRSRISSLSFCIVDSRRLHHALVLFLPMVMRLQRLCPYSGRGRSSAIPWEWKRRQTSRHQSTGQVQARVRCCSHMATLKHSAYARWLHLET